MNARRLLGMAMVMASLLACSPKAGADSPAAWQQWQHLTGVVDVAGPRSDGNFVVVAAGKMFLLTPDGAISPFAQGNSGYSANSKDDEAYLVVTPAGQHVQAANCDFTPDDVFVLDIGSPQGVDRVTPDGRASRFASVPNVDLVNGIAFDTVGQFDHRLLVTAGASGSTKLLAIDCNGGVSTLTSSGPAVEGGIAVAPAGFGKFGGQLIAPDENSGKLWAFAPDGSATEVITPDLPTGGDTGVESLGFVPPGFSAAGTAYLADRGTENNPFPGNDSILRLTSADLAAAGVQEGDLLVSTEGGGTTVAVRCDAGGCKWMPAAGGSKGGHIEGHVLVLAGKPAQ